LSENQPKAAHKKSELNNMTLKQVKDEVAAKQIQGRCTLSQLNAAFDRVLQPQRFKDYCPNGLQVEGKADVRKLISGVTASLAFIERALDEKADALVVHHGYFFKGEDERIVGQKRKRIAALLKANVSLFAFHLPLDAHPTLGNNAQLGALLGFPLTGTFGDKSHGAALGVYADLLRPMSISQLDKRISTKLKRQPLVLGPAQLSIHRVAWCTGAAQDMLQAAIDLGANAFISGEVSERTTHLAREMGVVYIAAGHHATERYGVQALGAGVALELGINHAFVDDDNPV
jgi:dinuclear metal center YbgI/SA1388 family protein